jgi:hypothetical protein
MSELWPWATLALLGAYHGVNPAMGWLFAVGLGLQEKRRGAVLEALPPIALGHAVSIALVVALVGLAQVTVAPSRLRLACGATLIGFGAYKLVSRRHPRWVGMRVGFKDLTLWSALMSTAHGAGLMLVPVVLRVPSAARAHGAHAAHAGPAALSLGEGLLAVGVHTGAMFVAMGATAVVVYEKLGLAVLRRAWVNVDVVWAGALVVAGVVTLLT